MKFFDSYYSKTRITADTIDTGLYHSPEDNFYDPFVKYPIYYKVKVQICLLRFIWVTVWSVTVELTDEAIEAANNRAKSIADTLSCTGL